MEESLVKNAADKEQVKKAGSKAQRAREKQLNDIRFLLSREQGRRFLWRCLERCGVYRSSFTGNSQTFFNEGERNIGLFILDDIMEAAPDAYLLMLKENKGDKENG